MVHFPIPIKWKCNCSQGGWGGVFGTWIETPPSSPPTSFCLLHSRKWIFKWPWNCPLYLTMKLEVSLFKGDIWGKYLVKFIHPHFQRSFVIKVFKEVAWIGLYNWQISYQFVVLICFFKTSEKQVQFVEVLSCNYELTLSLLLLYICVLMLCGIVLNNWVDKAVTVCVVSVCCFLN